MSAPVTTAIGPHAFVSIKVPAEFRRWLKTEAASRGVPMYRLLEELVETGHGSSWRRSRA